jgi:uncharacterized protein (UPF0332 family)
MDIDRLFADKEYLEKKITFFLSKKHIRKIQGNPELVESYLKKARHNFEFYKLNKEHRKFNDWLIVTLYYALYHCALALITNRQYASKNHHATILILIKEYAITKEEVELLNELSISKEDAEFYTSLKEDRHDASYATNSRFTDETIKTYEVGVLDFINKTEEIVQ